MTFADALEDWTDIEVAAERLAMALGVLPEGSGLAAKWVYYSSNPLGDGLYSTLDALTALGFLEKRGEPDFQYRVAPGFRGHLGIEEIWQRCAPGDGMG